MNLCPITYEECGDNKYSEKGLKKLSPKLKTLNDFAYSAEEQRMEAVARAAKMSIQGVQPKLSVRLNIKKKAFEIVDTGGCYIFKPQTFNYREVPENEDITMRLAELIGIEVPLHGLVYSKDGSMTYFIRRFDRSGRNKKILVEDFAQLCGRNRETKYDSSMEKVVSVIDRFCTFPALERLRLFNLSLFNYLVGNEDMHLKASFKSCSRFSCSISSRWRCSSRARKYVLMTNMKRAETEPAVRIVVIRSGTDMIGDLQADLERIRAGSVQSQCLY
ncbi:MAG: hypothetical protein C4B58_11785 [Deltaproteobacteria bacterium]|nr:MAG: hypothetical protein C4B58_11785 [Deltaproteobacteria bacterium]